MLVNNFTAFYPSRPFWAGSKVNFADQSYDGWLYEQMVEEVFSCESSSYAIKVCRDGRIMIRIEALEQDENKEEYQPIEKTVKTWGEYLNYLNSFYLLLDSSTIEIAKLAYFNLHEITNRDAFRVRYENGKSTGEDIALESIASVFQMGRYSSSYRTELPIEHDSRIAIRQVIPIEAIERASHLFAQVVASPGLEKILASFEKSLSEYKVGNYETSVVLAWFIIENNIDQIWKKHINSLSIDLVEGGKKINRERRDFLIGRDFTISIVSNLLELWGLLPNSIFQDVNAVRGFRNKIVHGLNFNPSASEAQLALKTAQWIIENEWGLSFTPSMSYSVSGL